MRFEGPIWYHRSPWYMRLWKRLKKTDLRGIFSVLENYKLIITPQTLDIVEYKGEQYVSISGGYFTSLTAKCNLNLVGNTTLGGDLTCEQSLLMGTGEDLDFKMGKSTISFNSGWSPSISLDEEIDWDDDWDDDE